MSVLTPSEFEALPDSQIALIFNRDGVSLRATLEEPPRYYAGKLPFFPELMSVMGVCTTDYDNSFSKDDLKGFKWLMDFFAKEEHAEYKDVLAQLLAEAQEKFSFKHLEGVDERVAFAFFMAIQLNKVVLDLEDHMTKRVFQFLRDHNCFGQYLLALVDNFYSVQVTTSYFMSARKAMVIDNDIQRVFPQIQLLPERSAGESKKEHPSKEVILARSERISTVLQDQSSDLIVVTDQSRKAALARILNKRVASIPVTASHSSTITPLFEELMAVWDRERNVLGDVVGNPEEFYWMAGFFGKEENAVYRAALVNIVENAPAKFGYEHDASVDALIEGVLHIARELNRTVIQLHNAKFLSLYDFLRQSDTFGKFFVKIAEASVGVADSVEAFLRENKVISFYPNINHHYQSISSTPEKVSGDDNNQQLSDGTTTETPVSDNN